MIPFLRKIPGFRTGKWWKAIIASVVYSFIFITTLALLIPTAPTLALDQIDPTNKSSVFVAGKTFPGKPVYLLANNLIIQSIKADSSGLFYFPLNDLTDGNYAYTIEACRTEERDKCRSENILVVVDQTPPQTPTFALPATLPEDSEEQIVITGAAEPNTKVIATVQNSELPATTTNENGEFELKTGLVLGTNTINLKAVDSVGNESAVGGTTVEFQPTKYTARVERVVDGDTVKLSNGQVVRYIGIDTPETVHPSLPVQCYGIEASDKNRSLVEGKEVKLEKNVSETDKYGRLLRYVWLGNLMVNEMLVRDGYAKSSTYPPDVKYQDRFLTAQRLAQNEQKGLWGDVCNPPQPTATQTPSQSPQTVVSPPSTTVQTQPPPQPVQQTQPSPQTSGSYACDCSKTCPNMSSCEEAQYQLNVCGCTRRDADKDGIACDADCQ